MHSIINFWYRNWGKVCMKRSWQREDAKKGGPALHTDKNFIKNWALPGKRCELSTYIRFWKKATEISRFVISPLEILVKTKLFILKKSCKIIWHILGMKPKSLWFFLYCPWRLLLLRDNPRKFHIVFLQYFRKTQVLE